MLRRLYKDQPASFAFTPANLAWAQGQVTKYPEGRQASAVIPLLWRAQEQEGWLTRPAIEYVANMLGMANIRVLEVATFYFMFQLQPVGSVAHIQICGTTSCMICGAEELIAVCKEKISAHPHTLSADGKFSWEEVECLGACTNAPMAQIGKDYYEDLTADKLRDLIARFSDGQVPVPGPQNGRYAAEPLSGLTSLKDHEAGKHRYNASAQLATDIGDSIKRIDGTEVPLTTPWLGKAAKPAKPDVAPARPPVAPSTVAKAQEAKAAKEAAEVKPAALADLPAEKPAVAAKPAKAKGPEFLKGPRGGVADDLKKIEGIGPVLEKLVNNIGVYHFDQIASWTDADVEQVDALIDKFKGRIARDKWVAQAKIIVTEGLERFLERAKTNDY